MRTRILTVGLLALLILTACGRTGRLQSPGPQASPPAAATGGDRLFVRDGTDGGGISILDVASGKRERVLPLGVPAPDWSALYTVDRAGGKTTVRALNVKTGQPLRETILDGLYDLPKPGLDGPAGLSPNGRWLALHQATALQSRFVILDTSFRESPKRVELNSNFYFDALDDYGTRLFLIEVPSPQQPTQYQVRAYDLNRGTLQAQPVVDKTAARPIMQGTRTSSVASRNGQWLYTLYLNPAKGPFIHALNVGQNFAQCIFLPRPERGGADFGWSMALTPDGTRLFAANGLTRSVVEIDASNQTVRRKATLPGTSAGRNPLEQLADVLARRAEAKRLPGGGLALAPDGGTLFLTDETGLLAVNTADFSLRGRYLAGATLASVAVSPDGGRVYVVREYESQAPKLLQLDLLTRTVAEVAGALTPSSILRVEAK